MLIGGALSFLSYYHLIYYYGLEILVFLWLRGWFRTSKGLPTYRFVRSIYILELFFVMIFTCIENLFVLIIVNIRVMQRLKFNLNFSVAIHANNLFSVFPKIAQSFDIERNVCIAQKGLIEGYIFVIHCKIILLKDWIIIPVIDLFHNSKLLCVTPHYWYFSGK